MVSLEFISKEWRVLKNAPISFIILVVVGVVFGLWISSKEVSSAKAERNNYKAIAERVSGENDDFRRKLIERITDIEKAFSDQQIHSLGSALIGTKFNVEILYDGKNPVADSVANQLEGTFKDSGWGAVIDNTSWDHNSYGYGSIMLRTRNPASAKTIAKSLIAAGIGYEEFGPTFMNESTEFWLTAN